MLRQLGASFRLVVVGRGRARRANAGAETRSGALVPVRRLDSSAGEVLRPADIFCCRFLTIRAPTPARGARLGLPRSRALPTAPRTATERGCAVPSATSQLGNESHFSTAPPPAASAERGLARPISSHIRRVMKVYGKGSSGSGRARNLIGAVYGTSIRRHKRLRISGSSCLALVLSSLSSRPRCSARRSRTRTREAEDIEAREWSFINDRFTTHSTRPRCEFCGQPWIALHFDPQRKRR